VKKRDFAELLFAQQHAEYKRTGNPHYIWRAFQIARSKNKRGTRFAPVPEWVLDYFDQCATGLSRADSSDEIAKALGLYEKSRHSKRDRARQHNRRQRIFEWVLDALDRGLKPMEAFTAAEEKFGSSSASDIFYAQRKADKELLRKSRT